MPRARTSPQAIAILERERKALELRKGGATFEQIAQALGYSDRSNAHKAVRLSKRSARPVRRPRCAERLVRGKWAGRAAWPPLLCWGVPRVPLSLIEFPADDPERARRFWMQLLGVELQARDASDGEGWKTRSGDPGLGLHARGRGPGDSFSLPYFAVSDIAEALERVRTFGGTVVHPGERWAICKDSEGSPFGLSQDLRAE